MQEYPKRKPQRLKNWDYAANGAYFITICTQNHIPLFCHTVDGHMILNSAGEMVAQRLLNMENQGVTVEKYCIMPNHIHMILLLEGNGTTQGSFPTTVSQLVQRLKTITTKLYIDGVKAGIYPPFHQKIWQKSFHDHIIRNRTSYEKIWEYIDTNPLKWEQDCYHVSQP